MKKMLLSAAFLAAMTSVSAQKLTYVPYADNGYLMGTYISSDGRYIAGCDAGGQGFIYDTQNGQIKYFVSPENGDETKDASTEVRAVNPDGTGVGYVGDKLCKFDFNTGEYTDLGVNEPALANTMSTDGSVIGGFAWDENTYMQHPIYLKDGVKYDLPMPTSTWLGYEANGFGLTGANADGSMFLGYVQDDFAAYPICVWVLNQDGKTYSVIPVSKRFYDSSIELSGPQPMDYFNGAFMSANGRWVALSVHNKDNTEQSYTLARYDVLNDALEYISCPEATQTLAYYATAISDDGTMIGYINDETSNARTGVICLAGDTVAHRLSEAFPQVPELGQLDVYELNTPCCITPDGRYITGFGYVDLDDENLCFGTYWIDTKTTDAVDKVSEAAPATKVVGSYGVDGKAKRIAAPKGLRLDKLANGKVKKVVVK